MAHLLRYGASSLGSIVRANPQHNFAHTHALLIYDSNAVYSMIPKNGCTTMRLSIALKNGAIADQSQWSWVHQNNDSFRPNLRELALAQYRFAILRCPYGRLVSCFLDKFVKRTPEAWQFQAVASGVPELGKLTFRKFCTEVVRPPIKTLNIHWRPQVDFLVYAAYDDYFCFENFGAIGAVLAEKTGMALVDARPFAKHDAGQLGELPGDSSFADTEVWRIETILMGGLCPAPERFFDDELKDTIARAYMADFKLYRQNFAGHGLFADAAIAAA